MEGNFFTVVPVLLEAPHYDGGVWMEFGEEVGGVIYSSAERKTKSSARKAMEGWSGCSNLVAKVVAVSWHHSKLR